ncbi:MAG: 3-phosphoglycerate dehydrogenase [Proteobacteria bacterium]|nr:MAG: 3-phosphoglycerate dehydrogenase [Pseudomonadota bacterium]
MKKIKTYNQIALKGLEIFPRDKYEVASEIQHPDGIVLRSQKLHDEPLPESVQAIARAGAGTNNVPVQACSEKGIVVFNTPGANANAVKELVLAGLLLGCRGISQSMEYIKGQTAITDGAELSRLMEKEKKQFKGIELAGKTLGVVGLGAIGSEVANTALALGMKVVGYDPAISVEAAWRLSSNVRKMENLQSLLAHSDFITLHVPAIDATKNLINSDSLKSAKKGLVVVNFARAEIVNTADMVQALQDGTVGKYVSDFPSPELLPLANALLMPHIGASTNEAEENCAVMAATQMVDFLENGNIKNSVNFPNIHMERNGGHRITFANNNVSGVLGQVLSVLAERNINVVDMLNRSRNDLAYNILDVEQQPSEDVLAEIKAVEHVINVRAL